MKKKLKLFLLTLVIIGGTVFGIYYYNSNSKMSNESKYSPRIQLSKDSLDLVISEDKLKFAFSEYLQTFLPGKILPIINFETFSGQIISTNDLIGKRKLLYYASRDCVCCKVYYPQLIEWARKYRDRLQTIVFYQNIPEKNIAQELQSAGIIVIPNAIELAIYFKNAYGQTLLVNEENYVIDYFIFNESQIQELEEVINTFAISGERSNWLIAKDYIKKDQKAPDIFLTDPLTGNSSISLSDLKGKLSIIFRGSPGCDGCELMFRLAKKLKTKYNEQINLTIVTSRPYSESQCRVGNEYLTKYNFPVHNPYKNGPDPDYVKKYFLKLDLDIPIFYDGRYLDNRWGLISTPSIVILDEDCIVKHYYPASAGMGENLIKVEDLIIENISTLLED